MLRRVARFLLKYFLIVWVIAFDWGFTAPICNLYRWFWPVLKPEMSGFWGGWFDHWFRSGRDVALNETIRLWQTRPIVWWIYQIPWVIIVLLVLFGPSISNAK